MDSPENMYSVQVSPLHSPLLSWNVFLNTPYTDLPGGRSMMVMCHVLSPMQAMGQQKEDEFAMGGRETLSMSRVSELMLATPTATTCLYFNSRGRLLVGMNHASLSHRWLYKFPKKKKRKWPWAQKTVIQVFSGKKKRERDYKNTAKIKIKQQQQQQKKPKGSCLTSPRIEMSHSHHHSARARIRFSATHCTFLEHFLRFPPAYVGIWWVWGRDTHMNDKWLLLSRVSISWGELSRRGAIVIYPGPNGISA